MSGVAIIIFLKTVGTKHGVFSLEEGKKEGNHIRTRLDESVQSKSRTHGGRRSTVRETRWGESKSKLTGALAS